MRSSTTLSQSHRLCIRSYFVAQDHMASTKDIIVFIFFLISIITTPLTLRVQYHTKVLDRIFPTCCVAFFYDNGADADPLQLARERFGYIYVRCKFNSSFMHKAKLHLQKTYTCQVQLCPILYKNVPPQKKIACARALHSVPPCPPQSQTPKVTLFCVHTYIHCYLRRGAVFNACS